MVKLQNSENKKKTKKVVLLVGVIIIVIIGILLALKLTKNDSKEKSATEADAYEIVKPGKDTLDVSKIQGYSAKVGVEDKKEKAEQIVLSDSNLTVESIGAYSGSFIEDGSDEAIKNVTAMLITNNSDQMLQVALIDFQVNSNETASFKVTNLPAGTSTLVLESNKREFSDKDTYTYGNAATGYMDQPTLEEDKVELKTENGKITLKNKTDKELKTVYVYYKYMQIGGAYLGGITYRTPFENVGAGKEAEAVAAHFNPDSSQIMGVQILDN